MESVNRPLAEFICFCIKEAFGVDVSNMVDAVQSNLIAPKEFEFGDICFPTFIFAKQLKKKPDQIASELAPIITKKIDEYKQAKQQNNDASSVVGGLNIDFIDYVEAVAAYLNFFYTVSHLARVLPAIFDGSFLEKRPHRQERVMVEYSQPNTHKAFHVGHMRNVALGDSLVRLYEQSGYDVIAANYLGDEGTHIAKCLWYIKYHYKGEYPTENRGEWLGKCYFEADTMLDPTTLTSLPFPGTFSAKVVSIAPHPAEPKWKVVTVDMGEGKTYTVVCGGTGYKESDIVAYVPVGNKLKGRVLSPKDMKGVVSEGAICSEAELGFEDKPNAKNQIYILPPDTNIGEELTEIGRLPTANIPKEQRVADEIALRNKQVRDILRGLEEHEPELHKFWMETREWSIDEFKAIYDWIDARFDHYFYESEVSGTSRDIVMEFYNKGVLIKSEGAIGADLSKYKLGFAMLLKSDGSGLYMTKDIALAKTKFENFNIDRSIYVVDVSQSLHFQQVFKTLELMGFEQASKCYHLAYGLVVLPEGKMSSRKGNVIYFSMLRNLLIEKITHDFLEKYRGDWSDEEISEAARRIAIATIKYGMLNQDNIKNITFDLKEWTSQTGNTGPYLMYAYARTRSILRKVEPLVPVNTVVDYSLLSHKTERVVLTLLSAFQATVEKATQQNRPQVVCIYLYDLSKAYSKMFEAVQVKRAETDELRAARLALVRATGDVLKKGLSLLGIQTIERM